MGVSKETVKVGDVLRHSEYPGRVLKVVKISDIDGGIWAHLLKTDGKPQRSMFLDNWDLDNCSKGGE